MEAVRAHMTRDVKGLDSALYELDDPILQLKAAQDDAEHARAQAENALASAEAQRVELIRKGQAELDAARKQAHDLVQQVQNDAYALTDELRRIQKDEKASAAQRAAPLRGRAKASSAAPAARHSACSPAMYSASIGRGMPGPGLKVCSAR